MGSLDVSQNQIWNLKWFFKRFIKRFFSLLNWPPWPSRAYTRALLWNNGITCEPCDCNLEIRLHPIPDTWNAFFRGTFHITEKSLVNFSVILNFPLKTSSMYPESGVIKSKSVSTCSIKNSFMHARNAGNLRAVCCPNRDHPLLISHYFPIY